jgi:mRNA interferase YafQ
MYRIKQTSKYKKDLKRIKRRGYDISLLKVIIKKLSLGEKLDRKYKDHSLSGIFSGFRECHITPDWLLIYRYEKEVLVLVLSQTGTHSDLF